MQELDAQAELVRQREYLERNLATIRAKLKKDSEIHRHENLRVLQDNTQLLQEINNLRRELKSSRTHAHSLETELGLRKIRGHHYMYYEFQLIGRYSKEIVPKTCL